MGWYKNPAYIRLDRKTFNLNGYIIGK